MEAMARAAWSSDAYNSKYVQLSKNQDKQFNYGNFFQRCPSVRISLWKSESSFEGEISISIWWKTKFILEAKSLQDVEKCRGRYIRMFCKMKEKKNGEFRYISYSVSLIHDWFYWFFLLIYLALYYNVSSRNLVLFWLFCKSHTLTLLF